MTFLIFIAILVVLIWVHELGHFSVAKFFGIRVEEFAIGFPPRLFKKQVGETLYSFGLLLVGGFVKIFGENPGEGAGDPRALTNKSRPVQAMVMVAGIAFNLIFAWLALSVGYMGGLPSPTEHKGVGIVTHVRPTVVEVVPGSPAAVAGVVSEDVILKIETGVAALDTRELSTTEQAAAVRQFIQDHQDESMILTVERRGEQHVFLAKPVAGLAEGRKILGVTMADFGLLQLPPHLALWQGAIAAKELTITTAESLTGFFSRLVRGAEDFSTIGGPVRIVQMGSQAVGAGWGNTLFLASVISISLALFNLLPVPGLDGGRLLIIAIEGVLRRPLAPALANSLMMFGFALLIVLMLVVSYHDIVRLVG